MSIAKKIKIFIRRGCFIKAFCFLAFFGVTSYQLQAYGCNSTYIILLQILTIFVFYFVFIAKKFGAILVNDVNTEKIAHLIYTQMDLIHKLNVELQNTKTLKSILNRSPVLAIRWHNSKGFPIAEIFGCHNFLGYKEKEWKKINYMDLIHPEDRDKVLIEIKEGLENNYTHWIHHYRLRSAIDEYVEVIDDTKVVLDKNDKPEYFEGIVIDRTNNEKLQSKSKEVEYLLTRTKVNVDTKMMTKSKKGIIFKD